MDRRIGIDPVPDDADMIKWLLKKYQDADAELLEYLHEYQKVVQLEIDENEPPAFTYARLLNNLAKCDQPKLIRMLSAMIFKQGRATEGE